MTKKTMTLVKLQNAVIINQIIVSSKITFCQMLNKDILVQLFKFNSIVIIVNVSEQ